MKARNNEHTIAFFKPKALHINPDVTLATHSDEFETIPFVYTLP